MEFDFDESLFGTSEKVPAVNITPIAYNAKDTPPQWFLWKDVSRVEDETDQLQILKHRADFYYWSQRFADAVACTTEALATIRRDNHPLARDLLELKARALGRMGRREEAFGAAQSLMGLGQSEDQLIAAFNLQLDLCRQTGEVKGVLTNIQRLLLLLPSNGVLWWQYCQCLEDLSDTVTAALRFASALRARGLLAGDDVARHRMSSVVKSVEDCIANLRSTLPADIRALVEANVTSMDFHVSTTESCKKLTDPERDVNDVFRETFFRVILDAVHTVG